MKEIREIINAYNAAVQAGKQTALATVVHVNGSSYRRPGARMLITSDGELTGAISGGCLEGDALRKAMLVLSQQKSKLVTYDTNDEDDATIGMQLGCEGIIQVLFEPINANDPNNPVQLLREAVAIRQKSVLLTLFSMEHKKNEHLGTCILIEENGNISGAIPYPGWQSEIMKDVNTAIHVQESSFKNYTIENVSITAFIEYLPPSVTLVIIGAGNDALPLMQMAHIIGWDVKVVDGRSTHAKPERFISACQVLVSKPGDLLEQIAIDDQTAFVLMTHNYNYDLAMLKVLLQKDLPYIGLLGPKKKFDKMIAEMRGKGIEIDESRLKKVYGPVGLDIGAETPDEIALSIITEIKAVLAGKPGGSLRDKQDVIHSGNIKLLK